MTDDLFRIIISVGVVLAAIAFVVQAIVVLASIAPPVRCSRRST